jgi:hypothetical protein
MLARRISVSNPYSLALLAEPTDTLSLRPSRLARILRVQCRHLVCSLCCGQLMDQPPSTLIACPVWLDPPIVDENVYWSELDLCSRHEAECLLRPRDIGLHSNGVPPK